ncbi:MAG: TonB-dependent receptor plug domain-containing protein [bacterium]
MFSHSRRAAVIRGAVLLASLFSLGACAAQSTRLSTSASADSVNVGYGMQARRDGTSSVASLDVDAVTHDNETSVADLMDGRFAGVDILRLGGGRVSVRIRGARSMMNAEPLYVINGVPQSAAVNFLLADLDLASIKRIDVLKDASDTAVYGSRGVNGVILITLKHP